MRKILAGLSILLCAVALHAGQTAEFRLSGADLRHLAAGDINGDGRPDLAIANNNGTIPLLFNTGSPSPNIFSAGATNLTSTAVVYVALGDMNNDGRVDVVSARNVNGVSVHLQTAAPAAAGTFAAAAATNIAEFGNVIWLGLADFDADGALDIAAVDSSDSELLVYFNNNNGTGTFLAAQRIPIGLGLQPSSLATGDINGDGAQDIVVSHGSSNAVSVILYNSARSFFPRFEVAVGDFQKNLQLNDVNGDSKLDLLVLQTNAGNTNNQISLLLGNGDATFQSATVIPVSNDPVNFAIAESTGDGKKDIVLSAATGPNGPSLFGLRGNGDGTFLAATDFQFFVNAVSTFTVSADFDSDGQADFATSCTNPAPAGLYIERLNPRAVVTALSPNSAIQGGAAFTLTVTGTGFLNGATVQFNGVNRTTTFVSATQVTASIPAADLVNIGRARVTVVNPAPGGFASDPQFFAVFKTTAGVWPVTNTNDTGVGSLRFALDNVRANEQVVFDDAVFNLTNSDAATVINVLSELPALDDGGVTVDASGQRVTVNGSGAGSARGLVLSSSSNTLRGLTLVGFARSGVAVTAGAQSNTLGGSRSTGAGPNGQGLRIAGCGTFGIEISGLATSSNVVKGCWIGLDSAGLSAQPNLAGILISGGASGNTIGGTGAGEANAIGGNSFEGVTVSDSASDNNVLINNIVGAAPVTSQAQSREVEVSSRAEVDEIPRRRATGNGSAGMFLSKGTQGSVVGGEAAGQGNIVANNGGNGLEVRAAASRRNAAKGNKVGRNLRGGIALFDGSNDGVTPPKDDNFSIVSRVSSTRVRVRVQGTVAREGSVELFNDEGGQGRLFAGRAATSGGRFDIEAEVNDGENVTATLTDANGNTSAFQVLGPGLDTDGDGTPDALEDLAGTDKNSASDVPVTAGNVITSKASVSLSFAKTGADTVKLTLLADLPASYTPGTGTTIGIRFAGVSERLALVAKGASAKGVVSVKVKGSAGGTGTLTFSAKKDLRAALSQGGFVSTTTTGVTLSVPVAVAIDTATSKTLASGTVNMLYKATQGKSGKAAKAK